MVELRNLIYDIEIYPNLFMITFINADTNEAVTDAFEKAAIRGDKELMEKLKVAMKWTCFIVAPEYRNDLTLLLTFMKRHKLLIGYNSSNYDNIIMDFIMMHGVKYNNRYLKNSKGEDFNKALYNLSQSCISYGRGYDRIFREDYGMKFYKRLYDTIDIQKVLYLDKRYVSLKQVGIMLKWYLVQDLPYPYWETLNLQDKTVVQNLIDYNLNDCLITKKVFDTNRDEVQLRKNIGDLYHINVMNESRSGTANRYFVAKYSERTGIEKSALLKLRTYRRSIKLKNLISDKVHFESTYLNDLLFKLNHKVINVGSTLKEDKLEIDVKFNNKLFQFRSGGLHTKDIPGIYISDSNGYLYIDADVTSFYPRIILNEEVCPEHLDKEAFLDIVNDIVVQRVDAKELTKKIKKALTSGREFTEDELALLELHLERATTKNEALKIVINAIYGKLGDEFSPLYDLVAMYQTTINGQLFLLMLIELLAKEGFQNISTNTDGVITKVHYTQLEKFYDTCKKWEELTHFNLEYTTYEKYICYAVNDYIAIKEGFKSSTDDKKTRIKNYVKKKGLFLTTLELDKGYFCPVVAKVLEDYYCFEDKIEDSLYNNNDIYDFCISKKSNDDFQPVFEFVDKETKEITYELLQKNNRFYISGISTGGLVKKYKNPKPNRKGVIVKQISVVAKQNIKIFNKYYPQEKFEDYNVNYHFYYDEVMKIVSPIQASLQVLF